MEETQTRLEDAPEPPAPNTPSPATVPAVVEPYFDTTPSEMSRFLRLLVAGGGSGGKLFPNTDLAYRRGADGHGSIHSEHQSKDQTSSVKAVWSGVGEGVDFECATGPVKWLLDYLDKGVFRGDAPLRFAYGLDPGSGVPRIRMMDGAGSVSVAASLLSSVPRTKKEGAYTTATADGLFVTTHPDRRPPPNSPWEDWAARGYSVVRIPVERLARVLVAGGILVSHKHEGTQVVFNVREGVLHIEVYDPKNAGGDTVRSSRVEDAVVVGGATDRYALLFEKAEPFLAVLSLLRTPEVVLVHHPEEGGLNIVAMERDKDGAVRLRLGYMLMLYRDPKSRRSTASK